VRRKRRSASPPTGVASAGELRFQFVDGFAIHGYVFTATGFTGALRETDEAIPVWAPTDALPYHRMWADDRVWMPLLLQGRTFAGRFLFDGDLLLGCNVDLTG
jgi:8-oxo-dGTP diphosphatase